VKEASYQAPDEAPDPPACPASTPPV